MMLILMPMPMFGRRVWRKRSPGPGPVPGREQPVEDVSALGLRVVGEETGGGPPAGDGAQPIEVRAQLGAIDPQGMGGQEEGQEEEDGKEAHRWDGKKVANVGELAGESGARNRAGTLGE